jgi:hypothetical protein
MITKEEREIWWRAISELLQGIGNEWRDGREVTLPALNETFPKELEKECDAWLVEQGASVKTAPPAPASLRGILSARALAASVYTSQNADYGTSLPSEGEAEIFHWLLVELWHDELRGIWHQSRIIGHGG